MSLRNKVIRLAHANPELRPALLPILKEASFGKIAGYTHYFTLLNRSTQINLEVDRNLARQVQLGLAKAEKMAQAGEQMKRNVGRSRAGYTPFHAPAGLDFSDLSKILGEVSYGEELSRVLGKRSEEIASWASELKRAGETDLARTTAGVGKNLAKASKALERFHDTWMHHKRAYKPKRDTQAKAYAKYADMAVLSLRALGHLLQQMEDLDSGGKPLKSDFGFTDQEWAKVVAGAKKIIAAFEKDPTPWGTAGEYHNYDYDKYRKHLEANPDDYEGANEAQKDPSPTGPFKIMGPSGTGRPILSNTEISLNGEKGSPAGDLAHETFELTKNLERDAWNFCKTARKPYDAVVVSILALAKRVAPKAISISSDGGKAALKKLY